MKETMILVKINEIILLLNIIWHMKISRRCLLLVSKR